jgi:hypothetical protein
MQPRLPRAIIPVAGLLLAAAPALATEGTGWRNDGTGVVRDATPPTPGAEGTRIRWKTPTESWANGSPVRFGDMVCVTEEPTTVACFDMDSGARRWAATSRYLDTLQGEEGAAMREQLAQLELDEARADELRVELTGLQRELRRAGPGSPLQGQVERLTRELSAIRTRLRSYEDYREAKDMSVIGYATPTPLVTGGFLYAIFGNGVLSKFSVAGERQWSVWLGPPAEPMIGHDFGSAASLSLVGGLILAPIGDLAAVDPATGELRWRSSPYRHYGTPAVATVGGEPVIVTPGGELLDPQSGRALGPPIAQIEFVGPVAAGDVVYVIGTDTLRGGQTAAMGTAYRLHRQADGSVGWTELWERQVANTRNYATPLIVGDRLVVYYENGSLDVLEAGTGERRSRTRVAKLGETGTPSPLLAADKLILGSEEGVLRAYTFADDPQLLGELRLEPHLATPLLVGERVFVRGLDHLFCIE